MGTTTLYFTVKRMKGLTMKSSFNFLWIALSLAVTSAAPAMAAVMVVGPSGEVLSFKRQNGQIETRVCETNSLPSEVASEAGCALEAGTTPTIIKPSLFKKSFQKALRKINTSELTETEKTLLDQYFIVPVSDDNTTRTLISELEAKLKKIRDFKAIYPNDYDSEEEKSLTIRITALNESLKSPSADAQKKITAMVDSVLNDMSGNSIARTLRASESKGTILFQALQILSHTPSVCTNPGISNFPTAGSACEIDVAPNWRMVEDTHTNKQYLWNSISNLYVTLFNNENISFSRAQRVCAPDANIDWHLPTGYPERVNGTAGFSSFDSELQRLVNNGLLKVMPKEMGNYLIWSTSTNPDSGDSVVYTMHGHDGFLGRLNINEIGFFDSFRKVNMGTTVLCVGSMR